MIEVTLPTLHAGQVQAIRLPGKRKAIRCGRRWGKSTCAEVIACDSAIKKRSVGFFTPGYKYQAEIYTNIMGILQPVKQSSSKVDGVIRTVTGGRIDFWSLEDDRAGRSRKYHDVIIDEAAFTRPNMMEIWERSIEPTLLDYGGTAWVFSNTNGVDPSNFMYQICHEPKYGFMPDLHAPSDSNPTIPEKRTGESHEEWIERRAEIFADLKRRKPPLVFAQEYLAEFVDFSGVAFFTENAMLVDGQPVEYPTSCDTVFAVVDSALKDGVQHDGTGVAWYAYDRFSLNHKVILLDWDVLQIEGATLETWLPTVFQRIEALSKQCGARMGAGVAYIEDKASGIVLLQHARNRGWPAEECPPKLTSLGKNERAFAVSEYHYQGLMKMSRYARDKVTQFKEVERNHYRGQVCGFRIGAKPGAQDDLADCHMYALALTCGDSYGL